MAQAQIYEGTLDEIVRRHGRELAGRRLKVYVDDSALDSSGEVQPFHETATSAEWEAALRTRAKGHDDISPLLSDEAIDRESIYSGRGE